MEKNKKHYQVRVFYEDTDHSGVVYHANYLKFFERAREDFIGYENLMDLWHVRHIGFAVYKASLDFHEGAEFGDVLDIRTSAELEGEFRMNFHQEAWREGSVKPAVSADIQLVCISREKKLQKIPEISGC
ncbi:MAG: YbgC/FadM family acyl-CoA thioesterase [Thermodesulfobacteriota bacterium]|nr:YbgC/FadM family acyl-CoA thioesterase [Thermodesulfobacteriota bacterium]